MVTEAEEELAELLGVFAEDAVRKAHDGLESVPVETAADVRNLLVAVGIASEKHALLTGGPTQRTESQIRISLVSPSALRDGLTVIDVPARHALPDSDHR